MKHRLKTAVVATALALMASAPAQAAQMLITYTGWVRTPTSTLDHSIFGNINYGDSFTAAFIFDPDKAPAGLVGTPSNGYSVSQGSGAANPLTGSLTINGVVFDLPAGDGLGQFVKHNNFSGYDSVQVRTGSSYVLQLLIHSWAQDVVHNTDLLSLFEYYGPGFPSGTQGSFLAPASSPAGTSLTLFSTSVTAAPLAVAPIPEPGTWAMMLVGFGAVGTIVRWRRRISWQPAPALG